MTFVKRFFEEVSCIEEAKGGCGSNCLGWCGDRNDGEGWIKVRANGDDVFQVGRDQYGGLASCGKFDNQPLPRERSGQKVCGGVLSVDVEVIGIDWWQRRGGECGMGCWRLRR